MTPAALGAATADAIGACVADGALAADTTGRDGCAYLPAPAGSGAHYSTAAAFSLARTAGVPPMHAAEAVAARLAGHPAIADVAVAERGHLNVRLHPTAFGVLAAQIVIAGPRFARPPAEVVAQALGFQGDGFQADGAQMGPVVRRRSGSLARAADLDQARGWLREELSGSLAEAAGVRVEWADPEVVDGAGPGPVAALLTAAGTGGARYALLRTPVGTPVDPAEWGRAHPDNPAYGVRYAHAHAAMTMRQAADLGVEPGEPERMPGSLLDASPDRELLLALSELPAMLAVALRSVSGDTAVLPRYLERVADRYLGWGTRVPVLPAGDQAAGDAHVARLWLAAATRTVLAAGLAALGVPAPARM